MTKNILNEKNFSKFEKKLKQSENVLLYLDYDGTLSHFKKDPKAAYPVKGIKKVIKEISKFSFLKVAIISGRSLNDLKNMIKLNNVYYAGLHGLEMEDYSPENLNEKEIQYYKNIIKQNYTTEIKKEKLYLENKKFVLSIHYRNNYKNVKELKSFIKNLVDTNNYEIMEGRKILEIRPKNWDKGKAVTLIREKSFDDNNNPLEIYIGDDTTDEDAFSVINGFSIYVKNENQISEKASFYLNNPDEVLIFLKKLKNLLENI
ncbi:MAG: trehalose-phosphatase [Bacillota bacterium]